MRQGGQQRGKLSGFRLQCELKEPEEWDKVMAELLRSKIGRKARIRGTAEAVSPALLAT